MRIDQISLNLLKHKEQNQKQQRLYRTYQKNQDKAHCTSDKRTKNRNQGCKCNQNTYQHCIREPEYGHCHKEHGSQNHSLNALSCNKSGKNIICQRTYMKHIFYRFFRKQRIKSFFCLDHQFFFLEKHITGKNKSNTKVHSCIYNSESYRHCGRKNIVDASLKPCHNRIQHFLRLYLKGVRPLGNSRILFEILIDPYRNICDSPLNVSSQAHCCPAQFRDHYVSNNKDHKNSYQYGKHQAYRSGNLTDDL